MMRRRRGSPSANDLAECSWTPPAGRKNPLGIGVKEPPRQDRPCNHQQAECLVAAKGALLLPASVLLGQLLCVRLDAAINHHFFAAVRARFCMRSPRISIGAPTPVVF